MNPSARQSRGISYIRVPVELLALGISSAHELLILALTVGFGDEGLRLSNTALGELLGIDRRHVPRLIRRLVGKGSLRASRENGSRVLRATDTNVVSPPDTKVVQKRHQSGAQVTPKLPCPSITEVTEVTEGDQTHSSDIQVGKQKSKAAKKKPPAKKINKPKASPDVEAVFEHWNTHADRSVEKNSTTIAWHGHKRRPDGSLPPEIVSAIQGALADYSVEDIKAGIDNYATVLLGPEYYWSYVWPLATFLTVAEGRGRNRIPKWTKFGPDNFIREAYLVKYSTGGQDDAEQDIGKLAGCEPADVDEARRLYQEAGMIKA